MIVEMLFVQPASTMHFTIVVLMLAHRLRRWANINTTFAERLVF